MKDAYTKCYNTFMTGIEEDTDKCREISYFLTERINIVKMSILLKAIYKINSNDIFHIKRMAILKLMWNHKQPKQPKQYCEETKLEALHFLISNCATEL